MVLKGGVIFGVWLMNLVVLDNYEFFFKGFYIVYDLEYLVYIICLRLVYVCCIISDILLINNVVLFFILINFF